MELEFSKKEEKTRFAGKCTVILVLGLPEKCVNDKDLLKTTYMVSRVLRGRNDETSRDLLVILVLAANNT